VNKIACVLICFAAISTGTICGADAKGIRVTPEMLQTFRAIIQLNEAADKTLYGYMETVGNWLVDFTDRTGRFPAGKEAEMIEARLSRTIANNPYKPVETANAAEPDPAIEELAKKNAPQVKVFTNNTLLKDRLDDFVAANISNAMEEPGTIVAISNGDNLLLVWGAGSDRRSIKDATGKPKLFLAELKH
jgi:hypothetical protein